MLRALRGGLNSFFVLILLGLLIASFAIWGIGDVFTARSVVVASVGETDINAADYQREFQNRVRTLQAQFGPEFDTQQALALGLHRIVLSEMIQRATLNEEARTLGLRAADIQVADAVREIDAFFGPDGSFSRFAYDTALTGAGLTAPGFEAEMRKDLSRFQLVDSVMAAKPLPKTLVDALYTFRKERRVAEIVNIPSSAMTDLEEVTEEELASTYEITKGNYMTAERRDMQLLLIDPIAFADDVEITEDQLRAAYDERAEFYEEEEVRTIRVMVLDSEEAAQDVYERATAGEDFAALADEILGFTEEDISIGDLDYYTLADDYNEVAAERVFALDEGAVSAPTQTLFGWHVFQVTGVSGGVTRTFDEVREELREEMVAERGLDAVYNIVAEIDDIAASGADMSIIAEATGLTPLSYQGIDHAGVRADGTIVDNAAEMHDFIETGFSKLPGDDLDMLDMPNGGFYIVQVDEIYLPEPRPFEEVKEAIRANLYEEQRITKAGARANEIMELAQISGNLQAIADDAGFSWFETGVLQRDQASIELSRHVKDLIFSLEEGSYGLERTATGDGYLVVYLKNTFPGLPDETSADYQALRDRLLSEMETDLITQYQAAVQNSLGIEVDWELAEQIFSPDGLAANIPGQF